MGEYYARLHARRAEARREDHARGPHAPELRCRHTVVA